MDSKLADQSAFAAMASSANGTRATQKGMTMRQYYAGQALAGLLANPNPGSVTSCAKTAVVAADALIEELSKIKP